MGAPDADVVGIGALKYADLSQNRTSDYIFSYARCSPRKATLGVHAYAMPASRSIFREGDVDEARFRTNPPAVLL